MEIKCTTCGKEVTPLELYDSSWSCPYCRNPLTDKLGKFIVTKDNEELFQQAELLYANWLFNRDGSASLSVVARAISLCRQSVRLGNSKALARLAYFYDKGYVGDHCSDIMRFKMAYTYYTALCYSGLSEVETEAGLPKVNWKKLREQTAYTMLYMLSTAPAELRTSKIYNLKDNIDRVQNELGLVVDFDINLRAYDTVTTNNRIFNVFCSCLNKQRAPLFGAFLIRVGDLIELYKRPFPNKEDKIPYALYWLTTNKKVLFAYAPKDHISDSSKMFSRLSTKNSVESMVDGFTDDEYIWTFFFNNNGGHKYLNQQKREKVLKTIYGRVGTDLLKTMLQNGNQKFYAFYDDDIYQMMKQGNASDATIALVDKICNGGEEI